MAKRVTKRKNIWPIVVLGVAAGAAAMAWCFRDKLGPGFRRVATNDPTTNLPSADVVSFRGVLQASNSPAGGHAAAPPGTSWVPGNSTNGGSGG